MQTKNIQIVIVVLALIIIGGFYYFKKSIVNPVVSDEFSNGEITDVIKTDVIKNSNETETEPKKEPLKPITKVLKTPNLDGKILVPDSFGTEGKRVISEQFSKVIAVLKKDPKSADDWLTLGVLKSQINDYLGAKEIWEYIISAFPKNPIAYGNLASLYAFDLKDAVKAEAAFKKALEVAPDQLQVYRNFAEFYKFALNDNEKAKAVLRQGVERNFVNSSSLQQLLDEYSK